MHHDYDSTTGTVVLIYWSKTGDYGARKRCWSLEVKRWKGKRINSNRDAWSIPRSVTHGTIESTLRSTLSDKSDMAIELFPHGSDGQGSSKMQVHTYNM